MNLKEQDKAYIAPTYNRFPVAIVSGKGSEVFDENGTRYIDLGSGIAVNSFGIADSIWIRAVTEQLGKVQHTSNLYYTEPCAALAQMLCERTGLKKVFFGNSGAEANECAIKAARKYGASKRGEKCHTVLTLVNSFHGRTLTTLAATGQEHYHELYQPLTPGFAHTPANDIAALDAAMDPDTVCGLLIECVQGEGGVIALDPAFVKAAAELAEARDILLMIDEVQTGNGRTGELYAYMHYAIQPDVVTTAKGLGGGLPIGACMLGEKVENIFGYGDHGSTFGGNPIACAGAISVLARLDDALLARVREKSEMIRTALSGKAGIRSVSGMGLMIGVETERAASAVVKECMEHGVLCLTAKNKVRLLPALNIPNEQLEEAMEVLISVCAKIDD